LNQTRTTRWTYTANGLVASMTDATGGIWQYGWDTSGNRTSEINPLGHKTSYAYDAAGRLKSQTDPNGLVTAFTWDARGRMLTQTASAETTAYSYTATGQLATAKLPSGYAVTYGYDNAQRLISATDNRGNKISYTLDAAGNRTREEVRDASDAIAKVTTRIVNTMNQVTQVQGALGQTTQLTYDANGEPISQTDPMALTTRQTLDGLSRPTATTFADSNAASQAWNQLDQLTAVTDPKGVKTSYTTNAFGDTTGEISPDIGTVNYQHDAMGRVIRQTDAKGNVTTWVRDALGRPTNVNYAAGHEVNYSWDASGQIGYLQSIEDKSGTTVYTRDKLGRITKKVQSVNDNPRSPSRYATSYSYAGGELASITYPSGLKVIYSHDATGQITGIATQASGLNKPVKAFVKNLAWTALNQPGSWSWSNGDTAARSFDADGRMAQSEIASYSYDAGSRIIGITQNLWATRTPTTTSTGTVTAYLTPLTFTADYDSRNRLIAFNRAGSQTSYSYDPNSNRLTAIDRVTSDIDLEAQFGAADDFVLTTNQNLVVDATSNKLLGFKQTVIKTMAGNTASTVVTPINYSLDANGSLTSDGLRSFEYDASNRLFKVKLSKDGEAASVKYLHNALGQRVFKSEIRVAQTLPNKATLGKGFVDWLTSSFQWMFVRDQASTSIGTGYSYADGALPEWALLGEYDNGSASGSGRTEYIWLPTPDGAMPIGLYRNGKLFAIHADHLGTPRLMTNEAKAAVWQWPYSAFGNNKPTGVVKVIASPNQSEVIKATAAVEMNLRFPGQYYDEETRAFHNYRRIYDQKTGQYWQLDPMGMAAGLNRVVYAGANPLGITDPTGQFPFLAVPGVCAAGGCEAILIALGLGANELGKQALPQSDAACCTAFKDVYEPNSGKHGADARSGGKGRISSEPTNGATVLANSFNAGAARIGYDEATGEIVIFRNHRTDEINCIKHWHGYVVYQRDLTTEQWKAGKDAGIPKWPRKPQ
jgi:RHS repeat-associated protein